MKFKLSLDDDDDDDDDDSLEFSGIDWGTRGEMDAKMQLADLRGAGDGFF